MQAAIQQIHTGFTESISLSHIDIEVEQLVLIEIVFFALKFEENLLASPCRPFDSALENQGTGSIWPRRWSFKFKNSRLFSR